MIETLRNPLTREYYDLKKLILSDTIPWYRTQNGRDTFSFFSHVFIDRPEIRGYPCPLSEHTDLAVEVIRQIFDYNNLPLNCIYRLNANSIEPQRLEENTKWHSDHEFPHQNILVYLTDAGGPTLVLESGDHDPVEDDVIIFRGEHCHKLPTRKRRAVLVATYA